MTDKLSRQQRRKLARTSKKIQAGTSNTSIPQNNCSDHSAFNRYKASQSDRHYGYRPSSKSPCYLIHPDNARTVWNGGWVPPGSTIEIAGRKIPGMVYVGKPPEKENLSGVKRKPSHVYIDPELEIFDASMETRILTSSNARTYDKIAPSDRGHYLNWLASDKADQEYDPAYMMMYFMGLEYRYFIDQRNQFDPEEAEAILREIDQLLTLYQPNSIKDNLLKFRQFIFYETVQTQISDSGVLIKFGDIDTVAAFSGGTRLVNGLPIESLTVLYLLQKNFTKEIKIVYNTCKYVFERQFMAKYNQMYPNGPQITIPEEYLYKNYTALFSDFSIAEPLMVNGQKIPDITTSKELKSIVMSIGTLVAKELQPYCHELRQNVLHFKTKKELEFLPDMGANDAKSKADRLLEEWVNEKIHQSDPIVFRDILSLFKEENSQEISTDHWYQTMVALHRIGYGVAPEIFGLLAYENADIEVDIFKFKSDFNDRTKSSGYYHTELISLIMGLEIFQLNSKFTKRQHSILKQRLDRTYNLTESENERLVANFERLQRVGYKRIIFEVASQSYNINTQIIRDTLKFYAEQDKSVISKNLGLIVYFYNVFNIDSSLITSDFNLTSNVPITYEFPIRD